MGTPTSTRAAKANAGTSDERHQLDVVAEPCFGDRALRKGVDRVETAHRRVVTPAPVETHERVAQDAEQPRLEIGPWCELVFRFERARTSPARGPRHLPGSRLMPREVVECVDIRQCLVRYDTQPKSHSLDHGPCIALQGRSPSTTAK